MTFEESRKTTRRDFLRKAALYTPPLILSGRAILAGGLANASPEGCSAGSLSTSSVNDCAATPLATLQQILAALIALPEPKSEKIRSAIRSLSAATRLDRWTLDGTTLQPDAGNVFEQLGAASNKLTNVSGGSLWVAQILASAATVATSAVANAGLTGKSAEKAAKAIAEAQDASIDGKNSKAIEKYGRAWNIAVGSESEDQQQDNYRGN